MKVLWLSNYRFTDRPDSSTGTWVGALGRALVAQNACELFNIVQVPGADAISKDDSSGVRQWIIPYFAWDGRRGFPKKMSLGVLNLIRKINPDIIHVWGLENPFGRFVLEWLPERTALLEIQGIRGEIAPFIPGNLSCWQVLRCTGLKEVLKPRSSLLGQYFYFASCAESEREIIRSFKAISYQSEWTRSCLLKTGTAARLFSTGIALRSDFRSCAKWERPMDGATIFASCGCLKPSKGLHILVEAVGQFQKKGLLPHGLKVRVAGGGADRGIRQNGYFKWVLKRIEAYGLKDAFQFTGPIPAKQLAEELRGAAVFVQPSFIESYSLSLAEAMIVGTPCVVARAGAMPELAVENESALFFNPGDALECAEKILRILNDSDLAKRLSEQAITRAESRNDIDNAVQRQIQIYQQLYE